MPSQPPANVDPVKWQQGYVAGNSPGAMSVLAGLVAGMHDATAIPVTPTPPPVVQPPKPPTRQAVPVSAVASLAAILAGAAPGTLYQLARGATYTLNTVPIVTAKDVGIDANGARIIVNPP